MKNRNNILHYLSGNLISSVIPFLLLPIMTRYLSPEEYGNLAIFMVTTAFLGAVVPLGGVYVLTRNYYRELMVVSTKQLVQTIILISLVMSVLFVILLAFLEPLLANQLTYDKLILILFSSIFLVIQKIRYVLWQVNKKSANYAKLQITSATVNFSISFLLVVVFFYGVEGRIFGYFFALLIAAIISLYSLYKNELLNEIVIDKKSINFSIKKGLPILPHVAASYVLIILERNYINSELSMAAVGLYFAAYQLSNGFKTIIDSINKAYIPWLFERLASNNKDMLRVILRRIIQFKLILILVYILVLTLGQNIFDILVGPDYRESYFAFIILTGGHFILGAYLSVANIAFYGEQSFKLSVTTIISGIFQIGLIILLGKYYGIEGVALAFLLGSLLKYLLSMAIASLAWKNVREKC